MTDIMNKVFIVFYVNMCTATVESPGNGSILLSAVHNNN